MKLFCLKKRSRQFLNLPPPHDNFQEFRAPSLDASLLPYVGNLRVGNCPIRVQNFQESKVWTHAMTQLFLDGMIQKSHLFEALDKTVENCRHGYNSSSETKFRNYEKNIHHKSHAPVFVNELAANPVFNTLTAEEPMQNSNAYKTEHVLYVLKLNGLKNKIQTSNHT